MGAEETKCRTVFKSNERKNRLWMRKTFTYNFIYITITITNISLFFFHTKICANDVIITNFRRNVIRSEFVMFCKQFFSFVKLKKWCEWAKSNKNKTKINMSPYLKVAVYWQTALTWIESKIKSKPNQSHIAHITNNHTFEIFCNIRKHIMIIAILILSLRRIDRNAF